MLVVGLPVAGCLTVVVLVWLCLGVVAAGGVCGGVLGWGWLVVLWAVGS